MVMNVTLPYDPTWQALEWAKKNCPSYITNSAEFGGKIIYYYFGTEEDAVMFKLKWS
jgi:hypothetical protein